MGYCNGPALRVLRWSNHSVRLTSHVVLFRPQKKESFQSLSAVLYTQNRRKTAKKKHHRVAWYLKHWFNGLWCHPHFQRGTLAHTETHPGRTPAVVSLESTSLCTWSMLLRRPEPNQDFQRTLMSPGGGWARRCGDSHLAFESSDFKKAFVCSRAELPSPHASAELCT